METPETLINFAWIGGEKAMREKVLKELNSRNWGRRESESSTTVKFIIELVKSIELTKVEK